MVRISWICAFVVQVICLLCNFLAGNSEPLKLEHYRNSPFAEDTYHEGPSADDWESPRAWNHRRHYTRATSAEECWPRVKFALPESTSGCPSGSWNAGSVRHALRSMPSVSSPNYLRADMEANAVELHFCQRDLASTGEREELDCLRHNPVFPAGSYCIFNGQRANAYERCPEGFYWSALGVDDVGHNSETRAAGSPPTGEFFPTFSHYYLCCRNDSGTETPITLPTSHAFILVPLNQEKKCQKVNELTERDFSIFLDTETESYFGHPDKNNAPYAATEVATIRGGGSCSGDRYGKGLMLHLCYYSRW